MTTAPIVLFAYNRPWHTEQTLRSLSENHLAGESELIVYIDGPKPGATTEQQTKIESVYRLVQAQTWCKRLTVHRAEANKGLANSVIHGVTETLRLYDRLIVLEDDMILSPYFLQYMNEGLAKYEHTEEVISIHGYCVPNNYSQPVFFLRGADCWGWATWRRGWQLFNPDAAQLLRELKDRKLTYDFDLLGSYAYTNMLRLQNEGKVDSWAIRWYASAYLQDKLTLYPSRSLVRNIGGDGSGTHVKDDQLSSAELSSHRIDLIDLPLKEKKEVRRMIGRHYFENLSTAGKLKKWLRLQL
ncbi:glycosyltransferase family protein [Flavisolibacter nicotianae]|uniref:glycosyltransferase n=1 Tax=Flavisolibacter nicotianae TaxID=2364882 RepID=UPI000EAE0ECF|nr:glycosyltransferase [Flavisolibacter nicotianae]